MSFSKSPLPLRPTACTLAHRLNQLYLNLSGRSSYHHLALLILLSHSATSFSSAPPVSPTDLKPRHYSEGSAGSALAPSPAAPEFSLSTSLLTPRFLAQLGAVPEVGDCEPLPFVLESGSDRSASALLATGLITGSSASQSPTKIELAAVPQPTGYRSHSLSIDTATAGTEAYISTSDTEMSDVAPAAAGAALLKPASKAILTYHGINYDDTAAAARYAQVAPSVIDAVTEADWSFYALSPTGDLAQPFAFKDSWIIRSGLTASEVAAQRAQIHH
ncbi:MAG TPA: hypothetical protein VJJ83_00080, partial [Candidatus Babeliales bacterium]|nr:hypothetical protein [Candidatus Babeliales bacterium]